MTDEPTPPWPRNRDVAIAKRDTVDDIETALDEHDIHAYALDIGTRPGEFLDSFEVTLRVNIPEGRLDEALDDK